MRLKPLSMALLLLLFVVACKKEPQTKDMAQRYFQTLAAEQNRQMVESFYSKDFSFSDVFLKHAYVSPTEFLDLTYRWGNKDMKRSGGKFLEIKELLCTDSTAVAMGSFSATDFNGQSYPATEFVIHLRFDKDLKIKEQKDFVAYDDQTLLEVVQFRNSFLLNQQAEP